MQHKKIWKKKIKGNPNLLGIIDPLEQYLDVHIKNINVSQYPNRPQKTIDLSIGDPKRGIQFKTHTKNIQIIKSQVGKLDGYTDFYGHPQPRDYLAKIYSNQHYQLTKQNVILTAGGGMAIWYTAVLLCNKGDNILFPSPAKSLMVEVRFYQLQPSRNWQCNIEKLQNLIDNRTKLIYVIYPSNPLGCCWSEDHKKAIIEIATRKNIPILADQIYEQVCDNPSVKSFAELALEQTIIFKLSALSKKWFGPGWRLGWLIVFGKNNKIAAYLKGLKNLTNVFLMPNTIMQSSLKQIMESTENLNHLSQKIKIIKKCQTICLSQLKDQPFCSVAKSQGGLYLAIQLKIENFKDRQIRNCDQFCRKFYAQQNVIIFPGNLFFSCFDFIRLVILCPTDKIQQFLIRFKRFLTKNQSNNK